MTATRTPLVGRTHELARIATALDAAVRGDPTFVLVRGEAGIGKTVLLRATAWLAAARGLRVLSGTAIASGASIPYLPLMAPLRDALKSLPAGVLPTEAVRTLLNGASPDQTPVDGGTDAARGARLVEGIYTVLASEPTLLAIDDVHWADSATLTVLDYLAHRAFDDPLVVVAAARDDEPERLLVNPIADGRRFLQLPVPRLSREAVREQVSQLSRSDVPQSTIDALFERSAGNPLYVEELMAEAAAGTAGSLPSLTALVTARVARLSADARLATDALAVLARTSQASAIAAVAALDVDAVREAMALAESGGVVTSPSDGYALRHPLFGEALLADLPRERAAALHRRAAEMLERDGAAAVERAPHWEAAGDARRTWSTSMAAATEADRAGAFAEASTNFERALAHWPDGQDGKGRAMLRAGYAAWHGNDADAALRFAQDAANAGAEPFEAWLGIAQFAWDAGERDVATEAFLNAYNALPDASSVSAQAQGLWALGRARVGQGRHADAYRAGIEAAHLAIEAGDRKWAGQAWVLAGMARAWNGDIGAVEELERGLEPSLESGDPEAIGHAYQFLVGMLWQAGRLDDAARVGYEGVTACERLGLARSHGADVRGEMALALIDLGRWAEGDALLEAAEARAKPIYTRGLLASRRGDFSAAERDLEAAASEPSIGGRGRLGYLDTLAIAECRWLQHDPQGAERALDAIGEPPGVWGIDMVARVALLRARLGRPGPAEIEHYDAGLGMAINAELAARRGGDLVAWSQAARAWEAIGHPYDLAIALLAAAEAAFATHDRAAGRRNLEGALAQASSLGSAPLVERAEALARRARVSVRVPSKRDVDVSALTPRELEVLHLLAEGRTNPQIAQHLFLSPKTVGIHVQRVLEKLESHTRGEAVATARRRGLLT